MSRIQEILARAERDGTAQRTPTGPAPMPLAPDRLPALMSNAVAVARHPTDADTERPIPSPSSRLGRQEAPPARPAIRTLPAVLDRTLMAAIAPQSPVAERYRAIRSRLAQDAGATVRTVIVTSPGPREGKSVTAANLALTMAQELQRKVVLVDTNLRSPGVHSLFGVDATPGLAEVLRGEATLEEALVYLPDVALTILPAGLPPQFPTELLGAALMRRTIDALRDRFDRVVLDLPAAAPLADVATVAPLADGVIVVVRTGITQRPALDRVLGALEHHRVLGIVLNEAT